jgi:hypothetical protein
MDLEKRVKLLEAQDVDRMIKNPIASGIAIISQYQTSEEAHGEHDQIYYGSINVLLDMSEGEVIDLGRRGWLVEEESLFHFT